MANVLDVRREGFSFHAQQVVVVVVIVAGVLVVAGVNAVVVETDFGPTILQRIYSNDIKKHETSKV